MKHRTLLMFALALMQTCITLAAEPFTRNQYEEMVRLFNGHQQTDTKHPFDKWTSLPLPGKPKGLEVIFLASRDEATGGFFFVDTENDSVSLITTYTFPMKFAFYSTSIEGGKIGLKAKSAAACFSYWTFSVFPDKLEYHAFVNECFGEIESASSSTAPELSAEIARIIVKEFMMEHDPVENWHELPQVRP